MSFRKERVASEIQKVVSERLVKGTKAPMPAFVTIGQVEVSKDMSLARIYFSLFGNEEACQITRDSLEEETPLLRREVGRKVRLRVTPELRFIEDETPAKAARIHELLAQTETSED